MMVSPPNPLPEFNNLPLRDGDPAHSAWGLWGDGPDAELGTLNYLTDEVVLKAIKEEVQTGQRVGLDLPLDHFKPPLFGRASFEQKLLDFAPAMIANDDVITFNTQSSSQWDSLRHYAYQAEQKFYNGTTQEQIYKESRTAINDLQRWCKKGIAGRGVLIDYAAWAEKNRIPNDLFGHGITLDRVKEIAEQQKVEFRPGDVFFLRTGYVKAYDALETQEGRTNAASAGTGWSGLAQSRETTEWLWERQFAAVVGDNPGFEQFPTADKAWGLHPVILSGWGTPIGELFNLEGLSDLCRQNNRWTFFFTSAPLNYTGAVGSPPNAVAIM